MTNARKLLEKHEIELADKYKCRGVSLHHDGKKHSLVFEEAALSAIEEAVRIERESCAKIADLFLVNNINMAGEIGRAIRARGNEGEKR